ncbi:MAG: hypothetical protein KY476_14485 [Planctomycetes bacterium]|nr:hypothetical protein [Planctomycetota bacterium]
MIRVTALAAANLVTLLSMTATALAQDEPKPASPATPAAESGGNAKPPAAGESELTPLNKQGTVLLDRQGKRLRINAKVVLREGTLEMLLCKKQTKEHESILAVDAQAYVIHAGLLALGAKTGTPVQFLRPKPGGEPGEFIEDFRPPTGQKIEIYVQWRDAEGRLRREDARRWMRHATRRFFGEALDKLPAITLPKDGELRYDPRNKELTWYGIMSEAERDRLLALSKDDAYRKAVRSLFDRSQLRPMEADFVFVGSGFYIEPDGTRYYQAEGGDVICVANFPTAMIDVAARSSASGDENLLFEAWTERIPPLETEVTLELVPVFEKDEPAPDEK